MANTGQGLSRAESPIEPQRQVMIVKQTKSVGVAILLTLFFGPLGMLYSTIVGAVVMFLLSLVMLFLTAGLGLFLTHPICIIWGAAAASSYNNKLLSGRA